MGSVALVLDRTYLVWSSMAHSLSLLLLCIFVLGSVEATRCARPGSLCKRKTVSTPDCTCGSGNTIGTKCLPWTTKCGSQGSSYCQYENPLPENAFCDNHVGTCLEGMTCKKTSASNNRRICVHDHAQLETTSVAPTTSEATTVAATTAEATTAPKPPCRTISTPNGLSGRSCHFPFRFQGVTYTQCTTAGGYSTAWCPTAYNAYESYHATGQWGYCGSSCNGATV